MKIIVLNIFIHVHISLSTVLKWLSSGCGFDIHILYDSYVQKYSNVHQKSLNQYQNMIIYSMQHQTRNISTNKHIKF